MFILLSTLYQPSFIYQHLSLSALGLIKGMMWKMPCNNIQCIYICTLDGPLDMFNSSIFALLLTFPGVNQSVIYPTFIDR
jgi:hypothetical protein